MGVMVGLSFAIVYSFLAIPAAWIADRSSRSWIMTIALALWSGFTAFCGLATTYSQLVIARMGVGVGEAGGVAPAYSLIADYFPPKQRATALAIYSYGIPIGAAAGILFGGLMAKSVGWRQAFMTIGIIGVVLAIPFKLMVRDVVSFKPHPYRRGYWHEPWRCYGRLVGETIQGLVCDIAGGFVFDFRAALCAWRA